MKKSAILAFIVGCCAFSFSQDLVFSRNFETFKKSYPLQIINPDPDFFYVLRYNKLVHDLTVERRGKPSGEITGFTPLKLDSVNADWFNYENLDYLFFEQDKKIYFLFEKVTNSKKSLYLKVIDTLMKSSGFIHLATIENDKTLLRFDFQFSNTYNNNILVTASQSYYNSVKKTVMLFDIKKSKMLWTKKLPLENQATGYSAAFACNNRHDLFYVLVKSRVISTQRKYQNHTQTQVPVFFYDTLSLIAYTGGETPMIYKKPLLNNLWMLNSIHLLPNDTAVHVSAHFTIEEKDKPEKSIYFLNQKLSVRLDSTYYQVTTALGPRIKEQLTFYDGTDSRSAADKEYVFSSKFIANNSMYQVVERRDENYYKELLLWQSDLLTGGVVRQHIVPRKVSVFTGRTRFKYIGEVMSSFADGQPDLIVLEAPENFGKPASDFKFGRFKKETKLWRSNIVMYSLAADGILTKKLIYRNAGFDLVPLRYSSKVNDKVFYFNSSKYEKFGFMK